jgi:signal transduction histidine kinase
MKLRALHARIGIRSRVAIAIIIALVSLQALAVMHVLLLSNRTMPFVSIGWLSNAANSLAETAFALPPDQRRAALRSLPAAQSLEIDWQQNALLLEPGGALDRISLQLKRTIEDKAEGAIRSVQIDMAADLQPMPFRLLDYRVIPEDYDLRAARPLAASSETDFLIPGLFRIGLQGPDGSWIVLSAIPPSIWAWPLTPLIGGGILIVILSTLTTRRILAPFQRLADAAERFGTERAAVPISTENLGELAPIAQSYNAMLQRLKRFVDDRTQMLAAISHDLRTSLTRPCQPGPAQGDERDRGLPHRGARRACGPLRERCLRSYPHRL